MDYISRGGYHHQLWGILGGIGVSGGTVDDVYVAKAALKAAGFSLDEVEATMAMIEGEKK